MIKRQLLSILLIASVLLAGFGCSKNENQPREVSDNNLEKEFYLALFNPKEENQIVNIDFGNFGIWEVTVPPSEKTTSQVYHTKGDLAPTYVVQVDFNGFDSIMLSWGRGSFGTSNGNPVPGPVNVLMSHAGATIGLLGAESAKSFLSEWRKDHEVLPLQKFLEDHGTPIREEPIENQ